MTNGQKAYEAYVSARRGFYAPYAAAQWSGLAPEEKASWEAAADAVIDSVTAVLMIDPQFKAFP